MVQVWKSDISLWESNIKTAPGQIKAYTNLGWAYFYNKDYAKALEVFRQERAINPDSINYDLAQGYRHFLDHNYQAAIKEFQLALQKKQDALYPLYLLARSYMIIGDQEGASMALKRILLSREIDFSDYRSKAQSMLERMQKENKQQSN
jgi:tetratricopeptide (TPR) repeat protein